MAFVIAKHKVQDYNTWRPHYDGDISRRSAAGIKDIKVFTAEDDPNDVTMYWEVDNTDSVKQMVDDPELKAKMQEAGVVSELNVWYLNEPS